MANHEAFDRRSKTRALAVLLLAIAVFRVAPAAGDPGPGSQRAATRDRAVASSSAQDEHAPSRFTLGLDAALPARSGGDFVAGPAPAASTETIATLDLLDPRAIVIAMRQQKATPAESPPAQSDGSFGRWLKRHWWVPALVGGALLATAGESLYDDDDHDDDD